MELLNKLLKDKNYLRRNNKDKKELFKVNKEEDFKIKRSVKKDNKS